jgi:hypothetical protein
VVPPELQLRVWPPSAHNIARGLPIQVNDPNTGLRWFISTMW